MILLFSFLFDWYHKMSFGIIISKKKCHLKMMTPGASRLPSDVTAVPALCTKAKSSPKGCFLSLDRYILTCFANLNIKILDILISREGVSAPCPPAGAPGKFKDSPTEDRPSRSPGQECSRPRPRTKDTNASVLQEQKNVFKIFFQAISKKKVFKQFFQVISKKKKKRYRKKLFSRSQNFNNSKNSAVFEPRSGQFLRT